MRIYLSKESRVRFSTTKNKHVSMKQKGKNSQKFVGHKTFQEIGINPFLIWDDYQWAWATTDRSLMLKRITWNEYKRKKSFSFTVIPTFNNWKHFLVIKSWSVIGCISTIEEINGLSEEKYKIFYYLSVGRVNRDDRRFCRRIILLVKNKKILQFQSSLKRLFISTSSVSSDKCTLIMQCEIFFPKSYY